MSWGMPNIANILKTYGKRTDDSADTSTQVKDIGVDFSQASSCITDYYATYDTIIDDLGEAAHDAIFNFFLYSSIEEEKVGFSILDLLFEVAFAVLPGEKFAKIAMAKAKKFYQDGIREIFISERNKTRLDAVAGALVKQAEEEAKKQLKSLLGKDSSSDTPQEFTAKAIDEAGKWARGLTAMATYERLMMRSCLDLIYEHKPERRGRLHTTFAQEILGPQPTYDPESIASFQKGYELEMYRRYYAPKAYQLITTRTEYHRNPKMTTTIHGIPSKVRQRVKELSYAATETSAVLGWNLRIERQEYNRGTTWDDHH